MKNLSFGLLFLVTPLSFPALLYNADQEFTRINYPLAITLYDSVLTASADSASVLWRLARVYVCMADVSPRELKLDLYHKAEAFARRCIHADSMKSEGHTWRAAALGNIAMFEGQIRRSDFADRSKKSSIWPSNSIRVMTSRIQSLAPFTRRLAR